MAQDNEIPEETDGAFGRYHPPPDRGNPANVHIRAIHYEGAVDLFWTCRSCDERFPINTIPAVFEFRSEYCPTCDKRFDKRGRLMYGGCITSFKLILLTVVLLAFSVRPLEPWLWIWTGCTVVIVLASIVLPLTPYRLANGRMANDRDGAPKQTKAAINQVHSDQVNALISAGADIDATIEGGFTGVMLAARRGNAEAVKALIAAGADLYVCTGEATALTCAVDGGNMDCINASGDIVDKNGWERHTLSQSRKKR